MKEDMGISYCGNNTMTENEKRVLDLAQIVADQYTKLYDSNELLVQAYKELQYNNWHNSKTGREIVEYLKNNKLL